MLESAFGTNVSQLLQSGSLACSWKKVSGKTGSSFSLVSRGVELCCDTESASVNVSSVFSSVFVRDNTEMSSSKALSSCPLVSSRERASGAKCFMPGR